MPVLYPVILAVPEPPADLARREKQRRLSEWARRALRLSADKSGHLLPEALPKNEKGAPVPVNGIYWSLTHKEAFAAGVAAVHPVGLDVEKIEDKDPASRMFARLVSPAEQALFSQPPAEIFFRCWTAKEAALKAAGTGLGGLSRCRLTTVLDDTRLTAATPGRTWQIRHYFFAGHLAALAAEQECDCRWNLMMQNQSW
ncbi:MAG: 4'-phosphopantetheinyl transferase family protein [Desulfosudaceae bacterium]